MDDAADRQLLSYGGWPWAVGCMQFPPSHNGQATARTPSPQTENSENENAKNPHYYWRGTTPSNPSLPGTFSDQTDTWQDYAVLP